MAQDSGFFNAEYQDGEYDRVYNAEQFAAYFAAFIGNGIFGGKLEELLPLANNPNNMSVNILSGRAWINGWWYLNDETLNMPIEIADGILSRKDIIVVRWGNAERNVWLQVIKGEPSYQPQVPEIRRDADYFDLKLCEIDIPAGTSKITQSQITDTRLDNTVCGLVTGVVDQIDTTSLYLQFRSQFSDFMEVNEEQYTEWYTGMQTSFTNWMNDEKADFDEWYAHIQSIIDESAVLHLQSEIDALDNLEYTSSDELNPVSSESVDLLQSGETAVSRWQKVSKMFKNIRYVLSRIGSTNISSIGSTITLAISNLSDALNNRGTNTYGTCTTAAATAAKVVNITNENWKFKIGSRVTVKFSYTNTAQNPTLNVNGTGAKSIWYNTAVITTGSLGMAGTANRPMDFVYDGTYWVFVGWSVDNNTTYSVMSQSELETGTATSSRVMRADYLKAAIQSLISIKFRQDNSKTAADLPTSFTSGVTMTQGGGNGTDFPATYSVVLTYRINNDRTVQLCIGTYEHNFYYRSSTGGNWHNWIDLTKGTTYSYGSAIPNNTTFGTNGTIKYIHNWLLGRMPLFGTSEFSRGAIKDTLQVDLTNAGSDTNKVGYVYSGYSNGLPSDCSHGIREVYYYNSSSIMVKITGVSSSGVFKSWGNIYNGSTWTGWQDGGFNYRVSLPSFSVHNDHNNWTIPVVNGRRYVFAYEKSSSDTTSAVTVTGGTVLSKTTSGACGFMIIKATSSNLVFNSAARGGFWDTKIAYID